MPKRPTLEERTIPNWAIDGWEKKSNPANQAYKLIDMPSPAWCKEHGHKKRQVGHSFLHPPHLRPVPLRTSLEFART